MSIQQVFLVFLCLIASVAVAEDQADVSIDFSRDILPILSDKCFACHGPDTSDEDELRLDSFEAATSDRGGYRAIDPADPDASELLIRIQSADDPMPPEDAEKQLSDGEKELLARWVAQGGPYAQHWAFIPPRKRSVPAVDSRLMRSGGNEIDAFVAAKLERQKLAPAPEADRETLARRVSLVLCGLPPEPDELAEFLNDDRHDAYERFVDKLLGKASFGEHQARHWLDAVRYGDTHGLHLDNRRGVYPYRDWVVAALNDNMPFDRFITWQLAGDLLPNPTMPQLVATGFVRMNPTTGEGGAIADEYQAKNNFDRTENLGSALLGMTLTCARCHTHKYDPVPQTEYYQLMAFFNSTAEPALDRNKYDYGPTTKAPSDHGQWSRWRQLEDERLDLVEDVRSAASERDLDLTRWESQSRIEQLSTLTETDGDLATLGFAKRAAELRNQIESLESTFTTTLVAKDLPKPRETRLLRRGEYSLPVGDPLEPGILSVMGQFPEGAPRNRLGLARWLTSAEHPTVTRVLVNRIWQQTFGIGLVRTPEDFGLQGEYPTHPDLLDWLAVELRESGWDLKHILRLMVTSQTFRQSSAWRDEVDDPENRLWVRGPSYRLDAEVIRDIGLWASGLLDPHMGGEGVKPYQPAGMWKALAHPASNTKLYERDQGRKLYRRSLYVYWKRTSPHPMMTLFDAPDRETSCVRRSRTSTALQSLALLNETQRIEMAKMFAERLLRDWTDDETRLEHVYRLLACRRPSTTESEACLGLLASLRDRYRNDLEDAKKLLAAGEAKASGDLNSVDHAAWTGVCMTLLASDLALLLY